LGSLVQTSGKTWRARGGRGDAVSREKDSLEPQSLHLTSA
jgi:hypothetical protein